MSHGSESHHYPNRKDHTHRDACDEPDAPDKATGKTRYINDMVLPHMLIGKILHAGRAHAEIVSIDTADAENLPGVHCVLTGRIPRA